MSENDKNSNSNEASVPPEQSKDDGRKAPSASTPGLFAVPARKQGSALRVVTAPGAESLIHLNLSVPKRETVPVHKPVRLQQSRPVRKFAQKPAAGPAVAAQAERRKRAMKIAEPPKRIPFSKASAPGKKAVSRGGAPGASRKTSPGRWLTNRYRLLRLLGEGGTGTVYKAQDVFLEAEVAVKILNKALTFDKQAIDSLKQEALIAMRLSHPHIVHLHNLDKVGPRFFLVMEYIEGSTLRGLLDVYGYLKLETVTQALSVCADALSYAHRKGVLHNDLKPENLLLTEDGVLKIIDFGIACLINTRQQEFIMGTPAYMSPEQIRGEDLDVSTDVYSMGIITYEMFTGKTPFPRDAQFQDVLDALPVTLSGIENEAVRRVVEKAIAPNRGDRYPSVGAYVAAFVDAAYPGSAADPSSQIRA